MPTDRSESGFRVNAYTDPVVIQVNGKASYLNSGPVRQFFQDMFARNKRSFVVDFSRCTSMDSTFLGIIAGAALELGKMDPSGTLVLCRLGNRNLELVRNLGLHRLCIVDNGSFPMSFDSDRAESLAEQSQKKSKDLERASMILKAHENLVEADESNLHKFQDVISYLKNQLDEE